MISIPHATEPQKCNKHLHAFSHLQPIPTIYSSDGETVRLRMGNKPAGIHHCCYDSCSVGLLQMGSGFKKKNHVCGVMNVKGQVWKLANVIISCVNISDMEKVRQIGFY